MQKTTLYAAREWWKACPVVYFICILSGGIMYSRCVLVRLICWQQMVKMVELGTTDVFFHIELNFIEV